MIYYVAPIATSVKAVDQKSLKPPSGLASTPAAKSNSHVSSSAVKSNSVSSEKEKESVEKVIVQMRTDCLYMLPFLGYSL